MKNRIAKVIGILSIPPLDALVLDVLILANWPERFRGQVGWFFLLFICLCLVPVLAYPVAWLIPSIRKKGRDGERKLAFPFTLAGYLLGLLSLVFLPDPPQTVCMVLLAYFFSAALLSIMNGLVHIKASGHACATVAPLLMLLYFSGGSLWPLMLLIPAVFWARLRLKRHTPADLVWGSLMGVFGTALSLLVLTGRFI